MNNTLNFYHYKASLINTRIFEAGHLDLSKYISRSMTQNEDRNMARHYVGVDGKVTVSMLCLSTSIIKLADLIEPHEAFSEKTELPTIKIGRLVVDTRYRGNGYGKQTLQKAIGIFVKISKEVGVIGLMVDSKKEAVEFYKKYGFIELNTDQIQEYTPMILFTNTLRKNQPSLFEDPV